MDKEFWKIDKATASELGKSLRKIATPSNQTYWYQGDEKYFSVFLSVARQKIDWIQITFRGHYLEWKNNRIVMGETTDYEVRLTEAPSSKMLVPHTNLNSEFIKTVLEILSHANSDSLLNESVIIIKCELPTLV